MSDMHPLDDTLVAESIAASKARWANIFLHGKETLPCDFSVDLPPFFYRRTNAYSAIQKNNDNHTIAWSALLFFWEPNNTLQDFLNNLVSHRADPVSLGLALRTAEHFGYQVEDLRQAGRPGQGMHDEAGVLRKANPAQIEPITPECDFQRKHCEMIERYVGSEMFTQLSSSKESCRRGLEASDSVIRCAAIQLMSVHWPQEVSNEALIEYVQNDDSLQARASAINYLAERYRNKDNESVAAVFAGAAFKGITPDDSFNSVTGIYIVFGMPLSASFFQDRSFHFDKGFVGSFLD